MSLKTIIRRIIKWASEEPKPQATSIPAMKINSLLAAQLASVGPKPVRFPIQKPVLPPGVIPTSMASDANVLACDASCNSAVNYCNSNMNFEGFPGYPYLSNLQQRSEYRSPSETTAMEMTRKWIEVVSKGDGDKSARIEVIEAELERHGIRDKFRLAAEQDGFFGRSQIYIKIKGQYDDDELRKNPLIIDPATIRKGDLEGFTVIEPMWTTPYAYNSTDAVAPDFYKPRAWFIIGKQTHASRLLNFISRPVPDILKPVYNFGGMSMSQLMEPYVIDWLETKDAVGAIVKSYSTSGIMTNMENVLQGGSGTNFLDRMKLFVNGRNNQGVMALDKSTEEFFQFNAPLSGLDALQAQAQEHQAAPCHMPLVKLLGITPTGLNASAEPEMDAWRDYIAAMQQNIFAAPLKAVINLIQLDKCGDIDETISFNFIPIEQANPVEEAAARKSDADAGVSLVTANIISPEEERTRLAADPNSGYSGINVKDVPEPLEDPDAKPDDGFKGNE